MDRPRACAAIINGDKILMVFHKTSDRTYWTFPGGAVEAGETPEQAVVREVKEETGLNVIVTHFLFEEEYEAGKSYCYMAELMGDNIELTQDFLPEEESIFGTMLHSAAWHLIKNKKDDIQVSRVISTLALDIEQHKL